MSTEIPQWVIEYNNAGHQSSAGKALRIVMEQLAAERRKVEDLQAEVTHWKGGYNAANETINEFKESLNWALNNLNNYDKPSDGEMDKYDKAKNLLK